MMEWQDENQKAKRKSGEHKVEGMKYEYEEKKWKLFFMSEEEVEMFNYDKLQEKALDAIDSENEENIKKVIEDFQEIRDYAYREVLKLVNELIDNEEERKRIRALEYNGLVYEENHSENLVYLYGSRYYVVKQPYDFEIIYRLIHIYPLTDEIILKLNRLSYMYLEVRDMETFIIFLKRSLDILSLERSFNLSEGV